MIGEEPVASHRVLVSGAAATDSLVAEAERVVPLALDRLLATGLAPARCEVSIALVTDEAIRDLNVRYRSKDSATDVLSFSQLDGDTSVPETWPLDVPFPIGDIVISIPRMTEQASEFGHSEAREFGFLLVHGLLHLLGFDHETSAEAARMREREEDVLATAGLVRDIDAD